MSKQRCACCIYECKSDKYRYCEGFTPAEEPDDDDYRKMAEESRYEYYKAWTEYINQYSEDLPNLTQFNN